MFNECVIENLTDGIKSDLFFSNKTLFTNKQVTGSGQLKILYMIWLF